MKDFESWFNPQEYADFLAESSILFEANVPLQRQKFENRKKLWQFRATKARQEGVLRMELARDAAQAKARGIQMGMGESFQQRLMNKFVEKLIEEKTPIKKEKTKMRPEVNPADRERDRKRESRKQDKMTGFGNILIVKHRGLKRVEIIEKGDFDPRNHELIKGKTGKADKGRVTAQDLQNIAQRSDFRNTKTSIRILGKVQKEAEEAQAQAQQDAEQNGQGNQSAAAAPPPPPPPPRPRVPADGKEITDESSTYPDWDHEIVQMISLMPEILNTLNGVEMSGDAQQALSDSRTLGDSLNRFLSGFRDTFNGAEQLKYQLFNKPLKTGKYWSKKYGPQSAPTAAFLGTGQNQQIGFNVKIGKQIRLCNKGESGAIFNAVMSKLKPEQFQDFSALYDNFINEIKTTFVTQTNYLPVNNSTTKPMLTDLMLNRLKQEDIESRQKQIIFRFRDLLEQFINDNEAIRLGYIAESLTGNIRFDGGPGTAQFMVCSNKDGSDTKVINLSNDYFSALNKSSETRLDLKFVQGKLGRNSPFNTIIQNISQLNESVQDGISTLEQMKDEFADPRNFMKAMGLEIVDAVFPSPVNLGDYYFEDSDTSNTLIINPGSSKEEVIDIPVRTNFTPDGREQNYIERGADELLESYLLINDRLVDMIKNNEIDMLDALLTLEEEFDFLSEKRNYRKEYDNYHSKPEQRANRSKRVMARRKMMKKGKVRKGDGKDVDHKDGNPQNNSDKNLRVLSKSKNRSMNEDHGAGFEGTTRLLKKYLKDTPCSGDPVPSSDVEYGEDKVVNNKQKTRKG